MPPAKKFVYTSLFVGTSDRMNTENTRTTSDYIETNLAAALEVFDKMSDLLSQNLL